jgi:hypothetical protein
VPISHGFAGDHLQVTTGPEIVRSGLAAVVFAALGVLWIRYVVPPAKRLMRFPPLHETRWARIWNYGLLSVVAAAGLVAMVVGNVAWSTGHTFK